MTLPFRALSVLVAAAAAVPTSAWGAPGVVDVLELRRQATNRGAPQLMRELRHADRAVVLGAIVAADAVEDSWTLLGELAVVAGGWDRTLAAPAAQVAARIARALDGAVVIAHEVPDDVLAEAAATWSRLVERRDRWPDVRVHALEVASRIQEARAATAETAPDPTAELLAWGNDADPEVRRAAVELLRLPVPASAHPALVARIIDDEVAAVAFAAAQALCVGLPEGRAEIVAALTPAGFDALRGRVRRPAAGAALLSAARCLAADDDPRSRRALARLRHTAPSIWRAAIARVITASDRAAASRP